MCLSVHRVWFTFASMVVFVSPGLAAPLNSKLLSLVPPGSDIVAGFENRHDEHKHGHLLLTTHNNRLDLDDWRALTGVDARLVVEEVVLVADSPFGGGLSEHLLLVSGRFDTERIFKAAEFNRSQRSECEGQTVMVIKPFTREQGDMMDTRWLAILDDRVGVFGTPWMVRVALHRYATHADIDMPLRERLTQLRRDVGSWNVLVTSPKDFSGYTVAKSSSPWARLMKDAEVLMVAVRFGPKVRVDFSLHANDGGTEFLTEKASTFVDVFATGPEIQPDSPRQRRLGNVTVEPNRVQASIEMPARQFDRWIEQTNRDLSSQALISRATSRGE